jgi:hypothetical protein
VIRSSQSSAARAIQMSRGNSCELCD